MDQGKAEVEEVGWREIRGRCVDEAKEIGSKEVKKKRLNERSSGGMIARKGEQGKGLLTSDSDCT